MATSIAAAILAEVAGYRLKKLEKKEQTIVRTYQEAVDREKADRIRKGMYGDKGSGSGSGE